MYLYMTCLPLAAATAILLPLSLISACRSRTTAPAPAMSPRLLFKLFLYALLRNTFTFNVYNMSLKYTSATVASAATNSMTVVTFILALLLRMEVIDLRSRSGLSKLAGVTLCLAGVIFIAFYAGPSISPHTHHPVFAAHGSKLDVTNGAWIKGIFLMLLACATLSLWIVLQVPLLKEYPNKLNGTTMQCLFAAIQSFIVAVVVERDFSRWKLGLDISLLAILYSAFLGTCALMYLQAWCAQMKGPVFVAMWSPLGLVLTFFCSSFFVGEIVHLGSVLGGILLVGGLYSVLWGKSKESKNRITPAVEEKQEEVITIKEKHKEEEPTSQV